MSSQTKVTATDSHTYCCPRCGAGHDRIGVMIPTIETRYISDVNEEGIVVSPYGSPRIDDADGEINFWCRDCCHGWQDENINIEWD